MIRINLLPDQFKKKARAPFKVLIAAYLIVTINLSMVAYWSWQRFGVISQIDTERSVLQVEMDGLKPQVSYHNRLEEETKVYASREKTLAGITSNRILWTRKVDQLVDLVNIGGAGVRHYIWFDDLEIRQENNARQKRFGHLKANGHSGSAKWDQVANFLEDVEDRSLSSFLSTFTRPASPEGTQAPADEDLVPSEVWSFPFSVALLSPEDRKSAEQEGGNQ